MAADFEISALSGTGTATIRVKPKAINEDRDNIKEQVLKVVVQGVEREVTLVQKANTTPPESWGTYFSITPDITSHTFNGTKRGETLEVEVYSYQQKLIDNVPQNEYRAVDWKFESTVDWLEFTQEVGELNNPGKLIIKSKNYNNEYEGTDNDPVERTGKVKIIQSVPAETTKEITITQSKGKVSFRLVIEGNGVNIGGLTTYEGTKQVTFSALIKKSINSTEVKEYMASIKVPSIAETKHYSGTTSSLPGDGGTEITYSGNGWFTQYGSWASSFIHSVTLYAHFKADNKNKVDQLIQLRIGAFPKWGFEVNPNNLPPGCTLSELQGDKRIYFFT